MLHALSDPIRLNIVRQLHRDGESPCAAFDAGRSRSTMSHHFRILREAGLVRTRAAGTTHLNSLCASELDAAFPGLLAVVTTSAILPATPPPGPPPASFPEPSAG